MPLMSVWPVSGFSLGAKRGVLLAEHVERFAELLAVVGALRLDRHRDDRLGKLDRLQQDRLAGVAQRVAGDRVAQADDADDVAGPGRCRAARPSCWRGSARAGRRFPSCRLPGLSTRLLGSSVARVDPHPGQVARLVRQHLEHEPAERLGRVGLAADFLGLLGRRLGRLAFALAFLRGRRLRPAARRAGSAGTRPPRRASAARPCRAAPSRTAPAESAGAPSRRGPPCG